MFSNKSIFNASCTSIDGLCVNHSPYAVLWRNRRELTDEDGNMDLVNFEHAIRRQARKKEDVRALFELVFFQGFVSSEESRQKQTCQ